MATSVAETMPITMMGSSQLRLKTSTTSTTTSGKLFRPIQTDATTKSEAAASNSSRSRVVGQQPARKKLTTLEAQRVMAVLTTAIRRVELASVLPQLVAERRADFDIGFGAELTRRLEEHGVLLGSLDELREAAAKQVRRTGSAASDHSARSTSALSQKSTSDKDDAKTTVNNLDDRRTSPTSTRQETLSRNVALVEERVSGVLRDLLRAFTLNPAACDSVLNDTSLTDKRSQSATELIQQLQSLRDSVMSRLLTTPVENVEWSRYLREVSEKENYNSGVIVKLTSQLETVEQLRDDDVTKQNEILRRLQADVNQVEKVADESVRRTRTEAEKQEAAEMKNSEGKLGKLQQELAEVRAEYANVLAKHRSGEQALRKRKFQVETEVENWIQKFDADMGERQEEYEEIDAVYAEEKKQLNELEDRFRVLETEYNRIMDERRRTRETREAAERHLQTLIRAALTIQAFWRSFKVRKAIKAKKRRGAVQKKGKKF